MKEYKGNSTVEFNLEKMKKLAAQDALIRFVVHDLTTRLGDEKNAYEVVFNSEVIGDTVMEDIYRTL
ncbi:hypothetical protein [Sutcliffiella cohnii]|uniref:hypothetical protein n=1 Tax=Sutcliffiella cohnii TaxID=33932 RepID=UPI00082DDE80|nr:hypothetical protein [Sutcliffiella cohnii]